MKINFLIVCICITLLGCEPRYVKDYGNYKQRSSNLCVRAGVGEDVAVSSCIRPIDRCDDIPGDASVSLSLTGAVGAQVRIRLLCGGQEILSCTATSIIGTIGGSAPPPPSTPGVGSCSDGPRDMVGTSGKLECDVTRVAGTPAASYVGSCFLTPPI